MRNPRDVFRPRPPSRPRFSRRAKIIAGLVLVVLLAAILSLRGTARLWTDYLWFDSLGHGDVWSEIIIYKIVLTTIFIVLFFALLYSNLVIADRLAPATRPDGPEEELIRHYHEAVGHRRRLVALVVAGLFALIVGGGTGGEWQKAILFFNSVEFGIEDAQFGYDIGFYVFRLPFIQFLISWVFRALIITAVLTAIAHYVNGGIRVQTTGQRVTPQVKVHLSVLLALIALTRAVGYWFDRFSLNFSTRGPVDGATYTDVNAQLPALSLLLLISVLSAVLLIINIWQRGWVLPVTAVGLWVVVAIVMGAIYPAIIQRFRAEPQESQNEAVYIERNIEATRHALGLDNVIEREFDPDTEITIQELAGNPSVRNIRLLDPDIVPNAFQVEQSERTFYTFNGEVDVDRYVIDGETTEVVVGARQLNVADIPQQSWEGRHIAYTHGYGVAVAPVNSVTTQGSPDFVVGDVPVTASDDFELGQPQLYIGENLTGYAIVGASISEVGYTEDEETIPFTYDGDDGVEVGSFFRQAAFALRFGDINPLISNFVVSDSRIIFNRDLRLRVETLAPFLEYDADPYPVISNGRVVYIQDAYTTSDRYPYSQSPDVSDLALESGLRKKFNYVRNSVKVVVDAYDGTTTFYVLDPDDPIIQAWRKIFPGLFEDFDQMPADLQNHLRYPEDLFKIQTTIWARYFIDEAAPFYANSVTWAVAQDPGTRITARTLLDEVADAITAEETATATATRQLERRIRPFYQLLQLPGEDDLDFVIFRTFVPVSGAGDEEDERKELTAFIAAKSDIDEYGELVVYTVPGTSIPGPSIVDAKIQADTEIADAFTQLNQQGSTVLQGNLLMIPVGDSLLFVRPVYVQATGDTELPQVKQVIAGLGNDDDFVLRIRPTLEEALAALTDVEGPAVLPEPAPTPDPVDEPADPAPAPTPVPVPPAPGDTSLDDSTRQAISELISELRSARDALDEVDRRIDGLIQESENILNSAGG
ncbi:UPF0182 family protein [Candidatus Poriferisocius sp.]|uniref:UPF0182 family membrane protein n=1 Tax=Candidatus Poriferisocius sp. TaxID=3101276 RepID=UPI003B5A3FD7